MRIKELVAVFFLLTGLTACNCTEEGQLPDFLNTTYSVSARMTEVDTYSENLVEYEMYYSHIKVPFTIADLDLPVEEMLSKCLDDYQLPEQARYFPAFVEAAHQNGSKVLCCFGGGAHFLKMVKSPEHMQKFAVLLAKYVEMMNLDGADVDWERELDLKQHAYLMSLIRTEFDRLGLDRRLYLTTALSCVKKYDQELADELCKHIDWVNIMCYDMGSGGNGNIATHNTPYNRIFKLLADNWSVFPKEKLCVGLASYGYRYNDMEPKVKLPEGEVVNGHRSSLGWNELLPLLENGWKESKDVKGHGSFFISPDGKDFISMETEESVLMKVRRIEEEGYRGIFWWEFHSDYLPSEQKGERGRHILMDVVSRELGRL